MIQFYRAIDKDYWPCIGVKIYLDNQWFALPQVLFYPGDKMWDVLKKRLPVNINN